jgi:serine/threonine-protein kinase
MYPVWSRSSRELFFRTMDNQIMVASYSVDRNTLIPEKPRIWSANVLANTGSWGNYDLSRDGQRVAALMPSGGLEGQRTQNHIVFLLNFFDELRRRVPPKGL